MIRINAFDVVAAYKDTGLIPIRLAWQTADRRGGCAIDALALSQEGISGEKFVERLSDQYLKGFLHAWDADSPLIQNDRTEDFKTGFWDAVHCRNAVEIEFNSIMSIDHVSGK